MSEVAHDGVVKGRRRDMSPAELTVSLIDQNRMSMFGNNKRKLREDAPYADEFNLHVD